jgi:Fic family protein
MSASERFGSLVYHAIKNRTWCESNGLRTFTTLSQVGEDAGVSKATAKKYLMSLVKMNVVATFPIGKRWVYQYVGDGRDI